MKHTSLTILLMLCLLPCIASADLTIQGVWGSVKEDCSPAPSQIWDSTTAINWNSSASEAEGESAGFCRNSWETLANGSVIPSDGTQFELLLGVDMIGTGFTVGEPALTVALYHKTASTMAGLVGAASTFIGVNYLGATDEEFDSKYSGGAGNFLDAFYEHKFIYEHSPFSGQWIQWIFVLTNTLTGETATRNTVFVKFESVELPTPTQTNTFTATPTFTPTATWTPSNTYTHTPTVTDTPTPTTTATATPGDSPTATNTFTHTPTFTTTPTNTNTPTNTPSPWPTFPVVMSWEIEDPIHRNHVTWFDQRDFPDPDNPDLYPGDVIRIGNEFYFLSDGREWLNVFGETYHNRLEILPPTPVSTPTPASTATPMPFNSPTAQRTPTEIQTPTPQNTPTPQSTPTPNANPGEKYTEIIGGDDNFIIQHNFNETDVIVYAYQISSASNTDIEITVHREDPNYVRLTANGILEASSVNVVVTVPGNSVEPDFTFIPTPAFTATPASTATPANTATPYGGPFATPRPTATPANTATPASTATPAPVQNTPTPAKTATPVPTVNTPTPAKTSTPQPTATNTATATPFGLISYIGGSNEYTIWHGADSEVLAQAFVNTGGKFADISIKKVDSNQLTFYSNGVLPYQELQASIIEAHGSSSYGNLSSSEFRVNFGSTNANGWIVQTYNSSDFYAEPIIAQDISGATFTFGGPPGSMTALWLRADGYVATNGSSNIVSVNHNRGNRSPIVQVYEQSSGSIASGYAVHHTVNQVRVIFDAVPNLNEYLVYYAGVADPGDATDNLPYKRRDGTDAHLITWYESGADEETIEAYYEDGKIKFRLKATVTPASTSTPPNTPTPASTVTPAPTDTPWASPTPMNTATPMPFSSPTPMNTATPKPDVFASPRPSATPAKTATPKPDVFASPRPTATPAKTPTQYAGPFATPRASVTPMNTATPKPDEFATPRPTATPMPFSSPTPMKTPTPGFATPRPSATPWMVYGSGIASGPTISGSSAYIFVPSPVPPTPASTPTPHTDPFVPSLHSDLGGLDEDDHTQYLLRADFASPTPQSIVTDHGSLNGLSDDDHTQYFLADGSRDMSGNIEMSLYSLTNAGSIQFQSSLGSAFDHYVGDVLTGSGSVLRILGYGGESSAVGAVGITFNSNGNEIGAFGNSGFLVSGYIVGSSIVSTNGYTNDGAAGMSDTRSWVDAGGNTHDVTISGGIITSWTVTP